MVEQDGLQSIQRTRQARLGALTRFKLIPNRSEVSGLVGWQQTKKAVRRLRLAEGLVVVIRLVVGGGVAGVYLDHVVEQQHT